VDTLQKYTEMGRCTVFVDTDDIQEKGRDWGRKMGKRARPAAFTYTSPWEK